ncbi:MAG: DNA-binding protein [Chlamydiales bacterium]|nr:DNA-binding protein [Chlamydiales bacterium]
MNIRSAPIGKLKRICDAADSSRKLDTKMEIVSLVGTLFCHGCHLHVALSDELGSTIGGHVMDGCIIYTTAEIIIGDATHLEFKRQQDSATGYSELVITSK